MSAFVAGAAAASGVALLLPPLIQARLEQRRRGGAERRGRRLAIGMHLLAAGWRRMAPRARPLPSSELTARIAAAGLGGAPGYGRARFDARDFMAAKLAAASCGAVIGILLGGAAPGRLGVLIVFAAPLGGFLLPDLWLLRRAAGRARRIRAELPGMLDLLRVTVTAGLPVPVALAAVGERTSGVIAGEWRAAGRRLALGVGTAESLGTMSERMPIPEIATLVATLGRAGRHGAPLSDSLAGLARDCRAAETRRVRERSARAAPKIQLVVALLLVPSVLLLVAAAVVAAFGGGRAVLLA